MAKKKDVAVDNPKQALGSKKLPMSMWPSSATAMGCLAFLNGALKYGRNNFRAAGTISAKTYCDAAKRHIDAWFEGEEVDPIDKVPHLGAALACIAIVIEADIHGTLIDDRNYGDPDKYREFIDKMTEKVEHLQELHKDKHPKHYTIEDNPKDESCQENL